MGRRTLATIRDHIVNVEEGGGEDAANIQPLCEACHKSKTHQESARGRGRSHL
jgi:5-methylcytosine-specific restriction protein A